MTMGREARARQFNTTLKVSCNLEQQLLLELVLANFSILKQKLKIKKSKMNSNISDLKKQNGRMIQQLLQA